MLAIIEKVIQFIRKDTFFVLTANNIGNFLNYLFSIIMFKLLGPEEYGSLAALLAIFTIVGVPTVAIQTVTSRYVSLFRVKEQFGNINHFVKRANITILFYSLIVVVAFFAISSKVADFLKLSSVTPVLLLSFAVVVAVIIPVNRGALQGLQLFRQFSLNLLIDSFLKLLLAVVLVVIGLGINGALGGIALAGVIAFLLAFAPLKFIRGKKKDTELNKPEVYRYLWPVTLAVLSIAVLTQIDIVLVKHYFPPLEAGYYAIASVLGKIALFLPSAIIFILFPKAVEEHATVGHSRSVLLRGLFATVVLSALVVTAYYLFPFFVVQILVGKQGFVAVPYIGPLSIAMGFLAITNVFVYYFLSQHNNRFLYFLMPATLLEVVLIAFIHSNLMQVIGIMVTISVLLLLVNIILVAVKDNKQSKANI